MILDLKTTGELRAMLPQPDFRDRLHEVYFMGVCLAKAVSLLVKNPRQLYRRARDYIRLRVFHESVLHGSEDGPT